jgi:uncharacterized protein YebE (UPF0316 family)
MAMSWTYKDKKENVTLAVTVLRLTLITLIVLEKALRYIINFCSFVSDVIYVGRMGEAASFLDDIADMVS